jgi:ankyrin repeat protein
LATDFGRCKAWLATRDDHTNRARIINVLGFAILYGRSDICQLILDSKRPDNSAIASIAIAFACCNGHLSVAQLIFSRCHPSTKHLYTALAYASANGHVEIVTWLLSEIKFSHRERVKWLLIAASARGDINAVRQLASHTGVIAADAASQALQAACYMGRVIVVDWLTMRTTADISLCGELHVAVGSMTSLTAACLDGHVNIAKTLLQCVTPHTVNIQCGRYNESALHFVVFCRINDKHWKHSLHSACDRANVRDVISVLYNADVDLIDRNGCTPLHMACQNGSVSIVQLLLSVFARVDITNNDRRIPIDVANFHGNTELVPYISQLVDVSNYTPCSSTALNVTSSSSATRPTVDVTVSDVSIVASDVRSTVQPFAHRDATNCRQQQQRKSLKVTTSSRNSSFKII